MQGRVPKYQGSGEYRKGKAFGGRSGSVIFVYIFKMIEVPLNCIYNTAIC